MRTLTARLVVTTTLCLNGLAIAQPGEESESTKPDMEFTLGESIALEEALEEADMEFTLEELDGINRYEIAVEEGYVLTLEETADGYTFHFDEENLLTPRDGNWTREFVVLRTVCPGTTRHAIEIIDQLGQLDRIVNTMIGSNDGGLSAYYEFSPPFTADQILDPAMAALERIGVQSKVRYDVPASNFYLVEGQFMQPSDFDVHFQVELGVVSEDFVLGGWSGEPEGSSPTEPCFGLGTIEWRRILSP